MSSNEIDNNDDLKTPSMLYDDDSETRLLNKIRIIINNPEMTLSGRITTLHEILSFYPCWGFGREGPMSPRQRDWTIQDTITFRKNFLNNAEKYIPEIDFSRTISALDLFNELNRVGKHGDSIWFLKRMALSVDEIIIWHGVGDPKSIKWDAEQEYARIDSIMM